MMTTYSVSARYRRFIEATLAYAVSETARDAAYRANPETAQFAIADTDMAAKGICFITIETDPNAVTPAGDHSHYAAVGSHLPDEEQRA